MTRSTPLAGATEGAATLAAAELSPTTLVGRQAELTAATAALRHGRALVLIEGEAGIGKTRLVRECLQSPQFPPDAVMVATCLPVREPSPLGALVDTFRNQRLSVDGLGLSSLAGALRPRFPEWASALPPPPEPLEDPHAVRHRLLAAVAELLDRLGIQVLVVEDAQWADPATLELLLMLLAPTRTGDAPSVVVTYRAEDVPAESLLWQLTSRPMPNRPRARVALAPLSRAETALLIGSMLHLQHVSDEFAGLLHQRTDGLPLAVEETVRLLADRRDLRRRGGEWARREIERLQVPPTVRDSVLERVARLDPSTRRLLEGAAVLAESAEEPLLATVADLDRPAVRLALADALRCGLLQEATTGRFGFRHMLASAATYEAIPVSERRRMHRRAGEALRGVRPPPVMQLARHFREANDARAWSRYAETAADAARESGDDHAAVQVLLELMTGAAHPPGQRARLARKLGEAALFGMATLGELAEPVMAVLRSVLDSDEPPAEQRGQLRLLLGRMLFDLGDVQAAAPECEAAIPDLGDRPADAARAMLHLATPTIPGWPVERHLRWLERSTSLLPRIRSETDRLAMVRNRCRTLLLLGEPAGWQQLELTAEAHQPASGNRYERWAQPRWLLDVGKLATIWGHYDKARQSLERALDLIEHSDYRRILAQAQLAVGNLDWYTGRWAELAEALRQIDDEEADPLLRAETQLLRALLALAGGERDTAKRHLHIVSEQLGQRLVEPEALPAAAALGRLYLADRAIDEALRVTGPDMDTISHKGLWLWATDLAPVRVEALVAAGRLAEAEAVVNHLGTWLDGRDAPAPAAALATCRATLTEAGGDLPTAAAQFAQAAQAWAALPRPYDELLAIERQARSLLATGEHQSAITLLTNVEQRLTRLGGRWDADRIAHLLRQHDVEIKRTWRGGQRGYGDQLSPRELEVVRLVATGLTTRQVAAKLWISPKTVTEHLGNVYRKLGVASRTALTRSVVEAGLLGDQPSPHQD